MARGVYRRREETPEGRMWPDQPEDTSIITALWGHRDRPRKKAICLFFCRILVMFFIYCQCFPIHIDDSHYRPYCRITLQNQRDQNVHHEPNLKGKHPTTCLRCNIYVRGHGPWNRLNNMIYIQAASLHIILCHQRSNCKQSVFICW